MVPIYMSAGLWGITMMFQASAIGNRIVHFVSIDRALRMAFNIKTDKCSCSRHYWEARLLSICNICKACNGKAAFQICNCQSICCLGQMLIIDSECLAAFHPSPHSSYNTEPNLKPKG
eukprot:scaffold222552_cov49-Prasinocladus_malaysianus.AAC.3